MQNYQDYMNLIGVGQISGGFAVLYAVMLLWSIVWKGVALWRAAKNDDKYWYVAILVVNTVGLLEILYIFFFSSRKRPKPEKVEE